MQSNQPLQVPSPRKVDTVCIIGTFVITFIWFCVEVVTHKSDNVLQIFTDRSYRPALVYTMYEILNNCSQRYFVALWWYFSCSVFYERWLWYIYWFPFYFIFVWMLMTLLEQNFSLVICRSHKLWSLISKWKWSNGQTLCYYTVLLN